ncbi:hypothetical protein E2P81_ATG04676 [Venturia nashicola]|uniref:Uncharacterized protein n=1 Tax=Venturia nashicola TaxID=86259 RepID=A0A4Z1PHS8_9PEZI|nr:hypothetical protein E6O75_ATG04784 [Venturia nashicola]TLD34511.1 hypothetical protein E2P81_ATG04676 [Venturia nashicola]
MNLANALEHAELVPWWSHIGLVAVVIMGRPGRAPHPAFIPRSNGGLCRPGSDFHNVQMSRHSTRRLGFLCRRKLEKATGSPVQRWMWTECASLDQNVFDVELMRWRLSKPPFLMLTPILQSIIGLETLASPILEWIAGSGWGSAKARFSIDTSLKCRSTT